MRKLKLQMQMTLDGFVGRATGEQDWMSWNPDVELLAFMNSLLDSSDTILLGRKTAEGFINHWDNAALNNPDAPFAKKIAARPKVVFTKTLNASTWNNTTLATGNLIEEITNLKKQEGNDLIVFGGAGFVSSLIKEGLIDEYHLIVNPVAIGEGLPIFKTLNRMQRFLPVEAKLYSGGKTVLTYKPKPD